MQFFSVHHKASYHTGTNLEAEHSVYWPKSIKSYTQLSKSLYFNCGDLLGKGKVLLFSGAEKSTFWMQLSYLFDTYKCWCTSEGNMHVEFFSALPFYYIQSLESAELLAYLFYWSLSSILLRTRFWYLSWNWSVQTASLCFSVSWAVSQFLFHFYVILFSLLHCYIFILL